MANENVISFKDAVLELQKIRESTARQEEQVKDSLNVQRAIVVTDAAGNKKLVEQEDDIIQQQKELVKEEHKVLQKEESLIKEESEYHKKSLSELKGIKEMLQNISVSIHKAIVGSGGKFAPMAGGSIKPVKGKDDTDQTGLTPAEKQGTELTENEEEADKKREFLVDKLIEGISGLKKSMDTGLGKLGKEMSGGFDKMSAAYKDGASGGGIMGGLSSLFETGKDMLGGGVKGGLKSAGGKLAGIARGGLNMISKAGPLATVAGVGLAASSLYDNVATNIDKSNEIEENVKSGALTRNQGNVLQGESLGDTAGTAAGAAIGGIAGSALGPLGAAAGAWLGGKLGGAVGGVAGKYGVKAYQGIKSLLGFGETKEQEQAKMSPEQKLMNQYTSGEINEDEYNKRFKLQAEGGAQKTPETPAVAQATPEAPAVTPEVTPTQQPTEAKTTGVWDRMKTGAMMAMPAAGLTYMAGKSIAGKAKEWGAGIKSWFGGTKVGQALADRNKGVGTAEVGETMPEMLVASKENLSETSTNDASSRQLNEGVATEKSALGSKWLGKLIAGKGTETENFLANSETADDKGGKYSQFMGKRIDGGWFGKDKYSITGADGKDVDVDKDTYMKAKGIASAGGDASKIGTLLEDYNTKKAAGVEPVTNEMGDVIYGKSVAAEDAKENATKSSGGSAVVNAPTVVNNTTNSTNTMRSPIKNEESSVNRYLRSRYGMA